MMSDLKHLSQNVGDVGAYWVNRQMVQILPLHFRGLQFQRPRFLQLSSLRFSYQVYLRYEIIFNQDEGYGVARSTKENIIF